MNIIFIIKSKNKIKCVFRKICIYRFFKIYIKLECFYCVFVDFDNEKVVFSIYM